jgi:hypothetical protein
MNIPPDLWVFFYDLTCALIVILAVLTGLKILQGYRQTKSKASLALFVFVIWFAVAYLEQALVMSLTSSGVVELGSRVPRLLSGICFTTGSGIAAAGGATFAILSLGIRRAKLLVGIFWGIAACHASIYFVFGENLVETTANIYEWVPSAELQTTLILVCLLAFVPAFLFLAYGLKVRSSGERVRGITLGLGFLVLGFFTFVTDNFSIVPPPIFARRIFIAAGIFLVYLGMIAPRWYLKMLLKGKTQSSAS